ncbi:MAG: peptidylprolyl isomerase [Proteobacteria bacterium]|nr:peptidylprolyl isomerase [Pseudomonadota bacterium]MBU1740137.1 peptidylprolyl isomerase [Pseudomonadota bacterium]
MLDLMRRKASGIIGWGILIFAGGALVAVFGTGDMMSCVRGYPDRVVKDLPVTKRMVSTLTEEIERLQAAWARQSAAKKIRLPQARKLDAKARRRLAIQILVAREVVLRLGRRLGFTPAERELTALINQLGRDPVDPEFVVQLPPWLDVYSIPRGRGSFKWNTRLARYQLYRRNLYHLVTGGLSVSPDLVYQKYRFDHESVEVEYLIVDPDRVSVTVTTAVAKKYYQAHPDLFRMPSRMKAAYLSFLTKYFMPPARSPTAKMIQDFYTRHRRDLYLVPRMVKVSHIQFNLTPAAFWIEDLWVRTRAEAVLALAKKVKSGREFARLAVVFAEQPGGKGGGGSLGYSTPGGLGDPVFSRIAAKLPEGGVSDLVRTVHGLHIIYKFEDRPARVKPLAKVRAEIVKALQRQIDKQRLAVAWARARARAEAVLDQLPAFRDQPLSALVRANPKYGLKVSRTGFFTPAQKMAAPWGEEPDVVRAAFGLTRDGQFSRLVKGRQGYYLIRRLALRPGRPAKFEEVRAKAKRLARLAARRLEAKDQARRIIAGLRKGQTPDALARKYRQGPAKHAVLERTGKVPPDVKTTFGDALERFRRQAFRLFPGPGRTSPQPFEFGRQDRLAVMVLVRRHAPSFEEFLRQEVDPTPILTRHRRQVFEVFLQNLTGPYLSRAGTQ